MNDLQVKSLAPGMYAAFPKGLHSAFEFVKWAHVWEVFGVPYVEMERKSVPLAALLPRYEFEPAPRITKERLEALIFIYKLAEIGARNICHQEGAEFYTVRELIQYASEAYLAQQEVIKA